MCITSFIFINYIYNLLRCSLPKGFINSKRESDVPTFLKKKED